jgi:2-oxoglutarate dehydrogenase E2 component (dihydrolipoamide succinyltransferase)
MAEVTMPRLNSNDDVYVLVEWLVEDGAPVAPGVPIATVETAKATQEIEATEQGILRHVAAQGTEWPVGTVIAHVGGPHSVPAPPARAAEGENGGQVWTADARELARAHGVGPAELAKRIVTRRDVEELIRQRSTRESPQVDRQSRVQGAVADLVSRAHREIPVAYVAVRVVVDTLEQVVFESAERHDVVLGPAEVLVKAVATLVGEFPRFFGSLRDDGSVEVARSAHVGVTTDVGTGLYVPVIHEPEKLSLVAVAETLMDYRIKAMRGAFSARELSGGNITVSLQDDPDVVVAQPIVVPGQAAVVCLCGTREELFLDDAGELGRRRCVNLGLAYDHRIVNGSAAVLFLRAVKSVLETRDALDALAG